MDNYNRYGGKGIKCLITPEELKILWFRDKAYEMKKPSIDRKNSKKNYIFNNCEFIEFNKNCCKESKIIVFQYNKDKKFIKKWNFISEASRALNINKGNIGKCLKNKRKTAGGFIWLQEMFIN